MDSTFDEIDKNINFDYFDDFIENDEIRNDFFALPGKEHYRLLAYLSTIYDDITIVDIGTKHGSSALALSYNIKNKIISFDICDAVTNVKIKTRSNITFQIDNIFESLDKYKDLLLSSSIIFIDTDPHQGI